MLGAKVLSRKIHMSSRLGHLDGIAIRSIASLVQALKPEQNFREGRRIKPLNAESNEQFENMEPASGKRISHIYSSGREETDQAVQSAKDAFESWSHFSDTERGRILLRASKMMRKKINEIARIETLDTGRTFWETCADAEAAADCLEYYSGLTQILHGSYIPLPQGSFAYTRKEPLGVCAGIGAWNFPFLNIAWKVTPALCCGNTAVYKPSPLAPLSSPVFAEILTEAGLPAGVLNVVQGGAETGRLLCEHDDVAKVSFTGGVPTASKVMMSCALGIKRVTLELGGKSPLVIFADGDIENAVKGALMANYLSQGEVCSNAARVYVEEPIYDQVLEMILKKVKSFRVGDPMDARTQIGAVISEDHLQKILGYVEGAKKEGASILHGGERLELQDPNISGGYFMSPCVMENCNDDMTIVKEEHFGPVMSVMKFNSEEEVLKRCNDTPFGLAGGVFTNDIRRAHRFIAKLQAGTCYINNYNIYPVQIPFGGYKKSGFGRENGLAVLENYTQLKTVYVEANDVDCAW